MAIRYPLVLNGSQIQELQEGDSLAGSADQANFATTAGTATNSNNLFAEGAFRAAAVAATPSTIPMRTSANETLPGGLEITAGSIKATFFAGTATAALFADLAEKYLADQEYEVGTVVAVGGEAEVTACKKGDRAFGAVSANPAYIMNAGLEGGTYIALKGRVPVKVIGPVKKGDNLLAADNGCCAESSMILKGMTVRGTFPDTFAIALETNDNPDVKLVEAIIL